MSPIANARAARAAAGRLPPVVRGAVWMVVSCALFSAMGAILREVSQELPSSQVVFIRNLFCLALMMSFLLRDGRAILRPKRPWLLLCRSAVMTVSMLAWAAAVARIPLADATALGFTAPLFATAGAAVALGERVGPRRWAAVGIGFLGMLVIVRPDVVGLTAGAWFAILCAVSTALGTLLVKMLMRTEKPETVVFNLYAVSLPLAGIPAYFVWQTPDVGQILWIAAMGALVTAGHLCNVRAFAATDASAVLPFDFSKLVFAAMIGLAAFGEFPDIWVWIGATVIFASTTYTARREAVLARQAADGKPPGS